MAKRSGRPSREDMTIDTKQLIIDTTIDLIKKEGADAITVRNVCSASDLSIGTFYHYFRDKDDLLMFFLNELPFEDCLLSVDHSNIAERICELYMKLINRYMDLGLDFMRSFYSTSNRSLSAYMGAEAEEFAPNTVMARCEKELHVAKDLGIITSECDPHELSKDICTIVKGCVFEWCLCSGTMDIEDALLRIMKRYFKGLSDR